MFFVLFDIVNIIAAVNVEVIFMPEQLFTAGTS